MPYVMVAVLAREEWLSEILDVETLFTLATNDANLHLIATFVDAKLAPTGHVAVGCRRNDHDDVRQAVPGWYGVAFLNIFAITLTFAIVAVLIL